MGKHKSRLEKEKEAAAAASKSRSGSSSPAVPKRLPSYMRPTSASKAMQVPKVPTVTTHVPRSVQAVNCVCLWLLSAKCAYGKS